MNIKGKLLDLLGYYVFTQNKAGWCKIETLERPNPKRIAQTPIQHFSLFFRIFHEFLGPPTSLNAPTPARASGNV